MHLLFHGNFMERERVREKKSCHKFHICVSSYVKCVNAAVLMRAQVSSATPNTQGLHYR